MREWYRVVRRAARVGLFTGSPSNSSPSYLSSGAFAVPKSSAADRFIGDRRPENRGEASIGHVALPYAPRLRRLVLGRQEVASINVRDAKSFYFVSKVGPERQQRQTIGPRVTISWLANLDDLDRDDWDDFESWYSPDLHARYGTQLVHLDKSKYSQIAVTSVIPGDLNAVHVAEQAHRALLLNEGVLKAESLLLPGRAFLRLGCIGDVYIDDLVIIALIHVSKAYHDPGICRTLGTNAHQIRWASVPKRPSYMDKKDYHDPGRELVQKADQVYAKHHIPVNDKCVDGEVNSAHFWGCELRGVKGTLGFPLLRRLNLALVTMSALAHRDSYNNYLVAGTLLAPSEEKPWLS